MLPVALLMGGLGTRLGPEAAKLPKALVDINGKPFLERQLRLLASQGFKKAVLCVGHLGDQIEAAIGDGSRLGLAVEYARDGERLLGTAGALRAALGRLGDAFFTLYGDSYLECNMAAVQAAFEKSGKTGLMTVYRNDGQFDASNVEYAGGRILAYDKKNRTPEMKHIDYGAGVFKSSAFSGLKAGESADLETVYRDLLSRGELAAYEATTRFYEIGSPEGLAETRLHLR
ncbi:MAG: nucleotidyltransferase family protein [Elusimicrobia bacterium]|nr:nucleotidyltransferase family protein [Elusimicrobiota bacterium]